MTYVVDAVRSKDGTRIGYRRYGNGSAIILIQAAIGTTESYHELAADLAGDFTVFVPERRGRPLSPCRWTPTTGMTQELEDLTAIFERSGPALLFGLSSGAVIALKAARVLAEVTKLAIYEPPFYTSKRPMRLDLVERYHREIEDGDVAAALVSALKAADVAPAIIDVAPRWAAEAMAALVLRLDDRRRTRRYPPLRELVPSIRFDFSVVRAMQDKIETFRSIEREVLLLSGVASPVYLQKACDALHEVLPSSRRIAFPRLDHSGPWNADRGGKPAVVAAAIREAAAK